MRGHFKTIQTLSKKTKKNETKYTKIPNGIQIQFIQFGKFALVLLLVGLRDLKEAHDCVS